MISALSGRYRLSKANIRSCLFDLYGLSISVGSISKAEQLVSQALEVVTEEVLEALRVAPLKHIDETTYYERHRLRWLWVLTNNRYTYFKLTKTRKGEVAQALLGEADAVDQRIVSDRYGAYHYLNSRRHQYCLAHLDRNLKGVISRGNVLESQIAEELRATKFRLLDEFKGKGNPQVIKRELRAFRRSLRLGQALLATPLSGLCTNLLKGFRKLWNFLVDPLLPQTNNLAERMLRHNVLWRRVSHGTQSERGNEYVERISTVQMTCRLQGRNLLAFLKEALQAHWLGKDPPTLLVVE